MLGLWTTHSLLNLCHAQGPWENSLKKCLRTFSSIPSLANDGAACQTQPTKQILEVVVSHTSRAPRNTTKKITWISQHKWPISSWWFFPHPSEKICASQVGFIFPRVRGENTTYLKLPPSYYDPHIGILMFYYNPHNNWVPVGCHPPYPGFHLCM